jgi:hypothetical protein
MPNSPAVWIVAICAIGLVVALMIWRGVGGQFRAGKFGFKIKERARDGSSIDVLSQGEIRDAKVGDIVGESVGSGKPPDTASIVVAKEARIANAETGDIIGRKIEGPPGRRKK